MDRNSGKVIRAGARSLGGLLRWMRKSEFERTYIVLPDGSHRRRGSQGMKRRARKDARKMRTSFPSKLVTRGCPGRRSRSSIGRCEGWNRDGESGDAAAMRVVYGVLLVLNIGAVVADSILSNFPMVLFHLVCLFGLCILFFGAGIEHRKPEPETEPKPEPNRIIGPYLIENWPREANEKYCIYDIRLIEVSDADPELFWCCTAEDAAGLVKALIDELK